MMQMMHQSQPPQQVEFLLRRCLDLLAAVNRLAAWLPRLIDTVSSFTIIHLLQPHEATARGDLCDHDMQSPSRATAFLFQHPYMHPRLLHLRSVF